MASILGRALVPFDFDRFVAELLAAIPGAQVTQEDYYAVRAARTEGLLAELGMPESCRPFVCLQEVAARQGCCRELEVPLASGTLIGRVNASGFLFTQRGEASCSREDAAALLAVIQRHPELDVDAVFDERGRGDGLGRSAAGDGGRSMPCSIVRREQS